MKSESRSELERCLAAELGSVARYEAVRSLYGVLEQPLTAIELLLAGDDVDEQVVGAELLRYLDFSNARHRARARHLAYRLLSSQHAPLVDAACAVFALLPDPSRITLVSELRHSPRDSVRFAATHFIGGEYSEVAVTELSTLAHDSNVEIRRWVSYYLSQSELALAAGALKQLAKDTDEEVRGEAIEGLARLRDPAVHALIRDELERDRLSTWHLEAAILFPSSDLVGALSSARERIDSAHALVEFDEAIEACRGVEAK